MMIAPLLALALQAAAPAAPPIMSGASPLLGPIGQQALPTKGCAAYLWSTADRQLVAMASVDRATLRVSVSNLFNVYAWDYYGPSTFDYVPQRTATAYLAVDF